MDSTHKHMPATPSMGSRTTGVTLIDLLVTLVIMAIAASMALSSAGNPAPQQLASAAKLVKADLEAVQVYNITHSESPRCFVLDPDNSAYYIANVSDTTTPIEHPSNKTPYRVAFGTNQHSHLALVEIGTYDLDGDEILQFGQTGNIDQPETATITLTGKGRFIDITVNPTTGKVRVGNVYHTP